METNRLIERVKKLKDETTGRDDRYQAGLAGLLQSVLAHIVDPTMHTAKGLRRQRREALELVTYLKAESDAFMDAYRQRDRAAVVLGGRPRFMVEHQADPRWIG